MKNLLTILFFLFVGSFGFAKGTMGEYFISGNVSLLKELIKSSNFTVEFNNKKWDVSVDENGRYEITIPWITACPSVVSGMEMVKANKELNPKWIHVAFNNHTLKVENQWRRYSKTEYVDKNEVTRKLDLIFD